MSPPDDPKHSQRRGAPPPLTGKDLRAGPGAGVGAYMTGASSGFTRGGLVRKERAADNEDLAYGTRPDHAFDEERADEHATPPPPGS